MTDELVRFIELEMKKGLDSYTIKKNLEQQGRTEDEILDAFIEIKKRKRKKLAYAGMMLLGAVILATIIYFAFFAPRPPKLMETQYTTTEANITERAIMEGNLSMCENLGELKPLCTGVIRNDVRQCYQLDTRLSDYCISRIAENTGSPDVCKDAVDARPTCYLWVAVKLKDVQVCGEAIGYEEFCQELVSGQTD
jgi:hypothetical protein